MAVGVGSALFGLSTILLALRIYVNIRLVKRKGLDLLWISVAYVYLSFRRMCLDRMLIRYLSIVARSCCADIRRTVHSLRHCQPLERRRSRISFARLSVRMDFQHHDHPVHWIRETCNHRSPATNSRTDQQIQALCPLLRGSIDHGFQRQSEHPGLVPVQACA